MDGCEGCGGPWTDAADAGPGGPWLGGAAPEPRQKQKIGPREHHTPQLSHFHLIYTTGTLLLPSKARRRPYTSHFFPPQEEIITWKVTQILFGVFYTSEEFLKSYIYNDRKLEG